jgi:hypothetical protein
LKTRDGDGPLEAFHDHLNFRLITDGVTRLCGAQLAALFEGLDWRRVLAPLATSQNTLPAPAFFNAAT